MHTDLLKRLALLQVDDSYVVTFCFFVREYHGERALPLLVRELKKQKGTGSGVTGPAFSLDVAYIANLLIDLRYSRAAS